MLIWYGRQTENTRWIKRIADWKLRKSWKDEVDQTMEEREGAQRRRTEQQRYMEE